MRQITEVVTCDVCGKTKVVQYVHIGVGAEIELTDLLTPGHSENEIYEIRPTQHACGKCANAIAVAAAVSVAEIMKKG